MMNVIIGMGIGMAVAIPFVLFDLMAMLQDGTNKKHKDHKRIGWTLIIHALKLLVYTLVLVVLAKAGGSETLIGGGVGLLFGLVATVVMSMKKGADRGTKN